MPRGAPDPTTGLTPQQEAFAQGLARGLGQAEAYRGAYPASLKWKKDTLYSRASELAADRKVVGRVTSLRSKAEALAINSVAYSLETAMAELDEAMEMSREKGAPAAFISAVRLRAELHRLLVAQQETGAPGEFGLPRGKDEATELLDRIRKEAKSRGKRAALIAGK